MEYINENDMIKIPAFTVPVLHAIQLTTAYYMMSMSATDIVAEKIFLTQFLNLYKSMPAGAKIAIRMFTETIDNPERKKKFMQDIEKFSDDIANEFKNKMNDENKDD